MNYIEQYYEEIITGKVTVSNKIRRVYKHLVDNINQPGAFLSDEDKANRAIEFIETFCRHSKGKFGGQPFILELWQKALVSAIFGFVDSSACANTEKSY